MEGSMRVLERIYEEVKKLPEPFQAEVLDFVQYLVSKMEREITPENELTSARLSLSLAMRGMEDEDTPGYSTSDLREAF
jgi:hypothetical protein